MLGYGTCFGTSSGGDDAEGHYCKAARNAQLWYDYGQPSPRVVARVKDAAGARDPMDLKVGQRFEYKLQPFETAFRIAGCPCQQGLRRVLEQPWNENVCRVPHRGHLCQMEASSKAGGGARCDLHSSSPLRSCTWKEVQLPSIVLCGVTYVTPWLRMQCRVAKAECVGSNGGT